MGIKTNDECKSKKNLNHRPCRRLGILQDKIQTLGRDLLLWQCIYLLYQPTKRQIFGLQTWRTDKIALKNKPFGLVQIIIQMLHDRLGTDGCGKVFHAQKKWGFIGFNSQKQIAFLQKRACIQIIVTSVFFFSMNLFKLLVIKGKNG